MCVILRVLTDIAAALGPGKLVQFPMTKAFEIMSAVVAVAGGIFVGMCTIRSLESHVHCNELVFLSRLGKRHLTHGCASSSQSATQKHIASIGVYWEEFHA